MGGLFSGRRRFEGSWIKKHSLSLVLLGLLVLQSWAFYRLRLPEWLAEQRDHGVKHPDVWPDFWTHYSSSYLVSILADTYGALLLVLFSKWFFEQGSQESKSKDPQQ